MNRFIPFFPGQAAVSVHISECRRCIIILLGHSAEAAAIHGPLTLWSSCTNGLFWPLVQEREFSAVLGGSGLWLIPIHSGHLHGSWHTHTHTHGGRWHLYMPRVQPAQGRKGKYIWSTDLCHHPPICLYHTHTHTHKASRSFLLLWSQLSDVEKSSVLAWKRFYGAKYKAHVCGQI